MPRNTRNKRPGGGKRGAPRQDDLTAEIVRRMEACPTAESMNEQVLMPLVQAIEDVCGARGYVLNVYGETANLVFTGDEEHAEAVYQIVEAYLDDQADGE